VTRRRVAIVVASAAASLAVQGPKAPAVMPDPPGYVCARTAAPIRIDGRLDDDAWRDAPWTTSFVDIEGDTRPGPTLRTRVKMRWDDAYFYIGAELEEPRVWATMRAHDSVIFHENDFEVFIDPNGDGHEYYELEINALGTYWDLLLPKPYKDGGHAVDSWEIPGLKSAVQIDGTLNDPRDVDRGWSVELAFPWKVLGELAHQPAPPHDGDQWRINFSRVEWPLETAGGAYRPVPGQAEHNWVWSPQGIVDMHRPEMWGVVQFSTEPPGKASFQPDPSLPARRWLQSVYYAERAYRQAHGRWAATLVELGVVPPAAPTLGAAVLEATAGLFEAAITLERPAPPVRWHIRQDALVWFTPASR